MQQHQNSKEEYIAPTLDIVSIDYSDVIHTSCTAGNQCGSQDTCEENVVPCMGDL